jgi:hypothetical protein
VAQGVSEARGLLFDGQEDLLFRQRSEHVWKTIIQAVIGIVTALWERYQRRKEDSWKKHWQEAKTDLLDERRALHEQKAVFDIEQRQEQLLKESIHDEPTVDLVDLINRGE